MIRFCKKLVIFKLSTDLKYLEVVQGGVSSLFFTCAPSHIGAVQRKHILKVNKILEENDHQSDWYAGKLGKFWSRLPLCLHTSFIYPVHVWMYWCTCYNYDATIRWTWYDSNDFFGSARAYGVLGCLWWHLEISAYSESAATSRDPTRCATYIRASGGTKLRKFSNFEATALACRMSCTKFSTKISTTALDIS